MLSTGCGGVNERQAVFIDWREAGSLPGDDNGAVHQGLAGPVSGMHNNVLIIGGGANFPDSMPWLGGTKRFYDDVYLFRRDNEHYTLVDDKRFKMPYRLAYGASCSTPKGVLYAGGENESGLLRTVLLIRYNSSDNELIIDQLPDLPFAIANASIATDGKNIYLAGGETEEGVSDKLFHMDLNEAHAQWTHLANLPHPVSHSILAFSVNNSRRSLYLVGGRAKNKTRPSDFFHASYRFDLGNYGWEQMASLPYALSAGTAWSDGECNIFLFGGDAGKTFNNTEELIFAISKEEDPVKREMLNHQKTALQAAHPGFSRDVLHYNACDDEWSVAGRLPFDAPVTTTAVATRDGEVIIPSGEIRAGVRSPLILQGTFSFDTHR